MIYPKFLKQNDTIGICAPSAGVGHKLEKFDASLNVLKKRYNIKETSSVRNNAITSNTPQIRAEELKELFLDDSVDFILCAAGGDFLYETLPYIDWKTIKKHPKWFMGMSDPTSILFTLTTKYDISTMYGNNAGSFAMQPFHRSLKECLELMEGKKIKQESFSYISNDEPFQDGPVHFKKHSYWKANVSSYKGSGRCIGGCMDVLKDLIGTDYDGFCSFAKRYKDDGIILYLDNFALSAETFYLTLLQMRNAHWFDHMKAVLIGRVLLPSSNTGLTYEEAIQKALPDIPTFYNADIGHTLPNMTLINGAILNLQYHNKKATISFSYK